MEILIELLVELFGELFFQLIFTVFAKLFSKLFKVYESNSKEKRIIKYVLVYSFFTLVLGLLVYSIVINEGLLVKLIIGYFIALILISYIEYSNSNILNNRFKKLLFYLRTVLHYVFSFAVLFITIFNDTSKFKELIISLSIVSIVVIFTIDMFRLRKRRLLNKNK